ncbi:MAG: DUF2341 domain-containing protein, partial [Candidatus Hodarchaeales archaeon]
MNHNIKACSLVLIFFLSLELYYSSSNYIIKYPVLNQDEDDQKIFQNWADTRFRYRKNITINQDQIFGNLTNFPLLVHLYDSDLKNILDDSRRDILFTDSKGMMLSSEIEVFDLDYNKTHAYLAAWVKTNLSQSVNTTISMYYGNSFINDQKNRDNVWEEDYCSVWHLEETTGTRYDSTNNNIDGNPQNYDND